MPEEFSLGQNYPNPFNPSSVISYTLPEQSRIRVEVFGLAGERVALLAEGQEEPGDHRISVDAGRLNLASGAYWYRLTGTGLETGRTFLAARKFLFLK